MSEAQSTDREGIGDLFEELEEIVDSDAERRQVREAMRAAADAQGDDPAVFGRVI